MTYKEFYNTLKENKMISSTWKYVLELIEAEITANPDKDDYLKLFTIYFSLIDDGNICMSLDELTLKTKLKAKVDAQEILLKESAEEPSTVSLDHIRTESDDCISKALSSINDINLPQLIGNNKMFQVEDGWLYAKKYNVARKGIISHIKRLFSVSYPGKPFSYKSAVVSTFSLSKGQETAVVKGGTTPLVITGGPGTGKTTSILFILLNLLSTNPDLDVYMVAPSGKAASRMKDSIIGNFKFIDPAYQAANVAIINKISKLEESTIHRLLSYDYETGGFQYNKEHQFNKQSVFVIDEASMIDVCIFNALLQAIPTEAKVYIMGDKNQLPSVDAGAVLADILKMPVIKTNNLVELDESIRFASTTKIYALAEAVNNGTTLPVTTADWQPYKDFKIQPADISKPIYYYTDSAVDKDGKEIKDKELIRFIAEKWGEEYYKDLQKNAMDLDDTDTAALKALYESTENGRILSALNGTARGINAINRLIKKKFIDTTVPSSVIGYYPGELMMITRNNKLLDLYNGDSGILVTFKGDDTLYFMVQKDSNIVSAPGKLTDKIFKLDNYVFYPLRMITRDEIELSYAITIHKSQGSDYNNILVILPKNAGHPLLNRQIIYTAITRTKGNTYIVSNQDRLEEAKDRMIERDTNIR